MFAVRIAFVALVDTNLPSEASVVDRAWLSRSGSNRQNRGRTWEETASRLSRRRFLVISVSTTLFRVGMDTDVASELVASAEALLASWMGADVRFFAGVGPNMSGLVLEAIESTRAERTLVGTRDLGLVDGVVAGSQGSSVDARICHVCGSWLGHIGCVLSADMLAVCERRGFCQI